MSVDVTQIMSGSPGDFSMFAVDVCGLPETGGSMFVVVVGLFLLVAGVVVARWVHQSAGKNVGRGGDDTLFALVDGTVQFGTRKGRRVIDVVPAE